jgi:N6-adenosine-specific RNA methylase IME4
MRYGAILADPPWSFKTHSSRGLGRSAAAHYNVLPLDRIKALGPRIEELAAKDACLFLWVTDPMLPQAMQVLDAWGFQFKTVAFYWRKLTITGKEHFGTGYWTRANPEQCWLATRGNPKPLHRGIRRLVSAPVRQHSRKPDVVREAIQQLCAGPYVELFARESAPGWDAALSDEAGLFDAGPVRTRRWSSHRGPDSFPA